MWSGEDDLKTGSSQGLGRAGRTASAAAALLVAGFLLGCERRTEGAAAEASDPAGYLAPPTATQAVRDAAGGTTLAGQAPVDAEVRLRDPSAQAFSATAGADGAWSIALPPAASPRMFAVEAELSGRIVHGEGAFLVLPPPGAPALLTRAGYGALPIAAEARAPSILAIDYDGGGGGSASGVAAPGASVRLLLDGQTVGGGQADGAGRFAVLDLNARKPFAPGPHRVRVETAAGAAEAAVRVSPPDLPPGRVFEAERDGPGWRVDWRIPGGGVQTTLALDPGPGAPS
jgi:hypothetical protein